MNQNLDPSLINNNQPRSTPNSNFCCGVCVELGIYILWALLFNSFLDEIEINDNCTSLSSSYQWGHTTYIFCLAAIVMGAFANLITYSKSTNPVLLLLNSLIRAVEGVTALVCFIGLCYAYDEDEECGKLTSLILAYIIVTSIGLSLCCIGVLVMFCCASFMIGLMVRESAEGRINLEQTLVELKEINAQKENQNL